MRHSMNKIWSRFIYHSEASKSIADEHNKQRWRRIPIMFSFGRLQQASKFKKQSSQFDPLATDKQEMMQKEADEQIQMITIQHKHVNSKKSGKGKRPGKGGNKFWKSIGLRFKTPREAIEGTYIDKKCPFTGDVSIRGPIIAGTCHSAKMVRTVIVRRDYLYYVKKYQRYKKRHSNIPAHISPCFRVKEGDHVTIGLCRPLSKTVRFNVLKVIPAGSSSGGKKAFTGI
ncbi:hypothetical protein M8C21_001108 [Ambrosia artemisiifolia]|uniref:Small ribosomal subunit protein uS17 n=1 Tax=Ambrosia artemisiifolia TaxID=4212 RepID=A0AAD5G4L8_AMBAR|nr:hypothetical protein M8C21_001108 [Ambrosia artemisiifolia]